MRNTAGFGNSASFQRLHLACTFVSFQGIHFQLARICELFSTPASGLHVLEFPRYPLPLHFVCQVVLLTNRCIFLPDQFGPVVLCFFFFFFPLKNLPASFQPFLHGGWQKIEPALRPTNPFGSGHRGGCPPDRFGPVGTASTHATGYPIRSAMVGGQGVVSEEYCWSKSPGWCSTSRLVAPFWG